jgi:hypothetical protein
MLGIVDLMDSPRNREHKENLLRSIELAVKNGEIHEAVETYRANINSISHEEYLAALEAGATACYGEASA